MGIARCKIRILQSRRAQKRQRWYMRNSVIKLRLQVLPEAHRRALRRGSVDPSRCSRHTRVTSLGAERLRCQSHPRTATRVLASPRPTFRAAPPAPAPRAHRNHELFLGQRAISSNLALIYAISCGRQSNWIDAKMPGGRPPKKPPKNPVAAREARWPAKRQKGTAMVSFSSQHVLVRVTRARVAHPALTRRASLLAGYCRDRSGRCTASCSVDRNRCESV